MMLLLSEILGNEIKISCFLMVDKKSWVFSFLIRLSVSRLTASTGGVTSGFRDPASCSSSPATVHRALQTELHIFKGMTDFYCCQVIDMEK
ncbi:hypothetical protein TNCT_32691 [Trichonephila clavata]|uniref:Uncharacterized protein n=1 Tax=Trichonephila clavata TaxID=2740835 RepID=A0A8X6KCC4_TRICU|nr:hypothetical protein TNCT_32691 [Trichonephila clavata]